MEIPAPPEPVDTLVEPKTVAAVTSMPVHIVVPFVMGWISVLVGVALMTAAGQMVDHPTILGRFLPLFWAGPVVTIFSAVRKRAGTLLLSALSTVLLVLGAARDYTHTHRVAGRYELWLAGAALLVTLAGWLGGRLSRPHRA
jgi:hypothetical protein